MKINFVCFGNICRSPMAEYVMKNLVEKAGLSDKIFVESSGCHATGYSQISSGTCFELAKNNISFDPYRVSRKFEETDFKNCDYIIAMDGGNFADIKKITGKNSGNKIFLMMEFVGENRDVDDPYITDDYAKSYEDIYRACAALLRKLVQS